MFDKKKKYYFVFSNEGEKYYLPSMLQLSLDDYIFYHLRTHNFDKVYHIRTTLSGDGTHIPVITIRSKEDFLNNTYQQQNRGLRSLFEGRTVDVEVWDSSCCYEKYPVTVKTSGTEQTVLWMSEKLFDIKTAIVLDCYTLYEFLISISEDKREALKSFFSSDTDSGTLVITFPMEIPKELFVQFAQESGIIADIFGLPCEREVINYNYSMFEYLADRMKDQIYELGKPGFDELGSIIDNAFFERNELLNEADRSDICNYLFYWLYNKKIRKESVGGSGIFAKQYSDENAVISRKQLHDFIFSDGKRAISERIRGQHILYEREYTRQSGNMKLIDILSKRCGDKDHMMDVNLSPVKIELKELSRFESMIMPELDRPSEYDDQFNLIESTREEWDWIRSVVRKPQTLLPEQRWLDLIDICCTKMTVANEKKDRSTVLRLENILVYCGNNLYSINNEHCDEYDKLFRHYIEYSNACYDKYLNLKKTGSIMYGESEGSLGIVQQSAINELITKYNAYRKVLAELDSMFIGIMSEDHLDTDQLTDLHKRIEKMVKGSDEISNIGDAPEIQQSEVDDIREMIKSDDYNSEDRLMTDMDLLKKGIKV